jgi:hypothetical protein
MLSNVIIYLVLRDSMSKKHYEKIMSRRLKLKEKAVYSLEQKAIDEQDLPLYMDSNGIIDWNRLAEHVKRATSGR